MPDFSQSIQIDQTDAVDYSKGSLRIDEDVDVVQTENATVLKDEI